MDDVVVVVVAVAVAVGVVVVVVAVVMCMVVFAHRVDIGSKIGIGGPCVMKSG